MEKISAALLILFVFTFACSDIKEQPQATISEKPLVLKNHHFEYGIDCEDLIVIKDTVQPDQNLSEMLSKYKVPTTVIHDVACSSRPVFDVRTIKAGNPFCIKTLQSKSLQSSLETVSGNKRLLNEDTCVGGV